MECPVTGLVRIIFYTAEDCPQKLLAPPHWEVYHQQKEKVERSISAGTQDGRASCSHV